MIIPLLLSPSRYYTVNRDMSADYYGVYGGPPYVDDYPLYPPGVRPESICSMSAAYNRPPPRWTMDERRRSLRDGPLYGQPRDPQLMMGPQGPAYNPQLGLSAELYETAFPYSPARGRPLVHPSLQTGGPLLSTQLCFNLPDRPAPGLIGDLADSGRREYMLTPQSMGSAGHWAHLR